MDEFSGLNAAWSIEKPLSYLLVVAVLALVVRAIMAALRAFKLQHDDKQLSYVSHALRSFGGFHVGKTADYWYPFFIGLFELGLFPIFLATQAWPVIGAWIGLKTLAQWSAWTEVNRAGNLGGLRF